MIVRDDLQLAHSYTKIGELEKETDSAKLVAALKSLYQGVEMTTKTFDATMSRFDIKQFNPLGEHFDPNFHEAMFAAPDPTKKAGTII